MNQLATYLEEAILLHDCVILPGIGGFVCRVVGSQVDEKRGVILSPRKMVTFNSALSMNDGVLIDFISRREHISYHDASRRVAILGEDVRTKINMGLSIPLGKIGSLHADRHSNIVFKSGNKNFLPETMLIGELQLPAPYLRINNATINHKSALSGKAKRWVWSSAAAAAIIAMGIGLYITDNDYMQLPNWHKTDKASFEPTFPFFPTTPQNSSCNTTISPECDYLDFVADI